MASHYLLPVTVQSKAGLFLFYAFVSRFVTASHFQVLLSTVCIREMNKKAVLESSPSNTAVGSHGVCSVQLSMEKAQVSPEAVR